jgi:hypothetical protein
MSWQLPSKLTSEIKGRADKAFPYQRRWGAMSGIGRGSDIWPNVVRCRRMTDTVVKVVLHWGSEILRAAGATFV